MPSMFLNGIYHCKRCIQEVMPKSCLNAFLHGYVIKQVGMWQSATPATQNDMTTCLETFEKERFCSFPHRHGINDATTRRRPDTTTRRATRGEQTLRYAFGKNRIIWDEHPKSSNHQLNAILPITNQHTQNLEFCMLIVISYVIS